MAGVRDPAFWRRFSMAVHMDEEAAKTGPEELKHSNSWLARETQKKSRRTCICWSFWLGFVAFAAAIVIVILLLKAQGILDGGAKNTSTSASADATPVAAAQSVALATKTISSSLSATATATLAARRS